MLGYFSSGIRVISCSWKEGCIMVVPSLSIYFLEARCVGMFFDSLVTTCITWGGTILYSSLLVSFSLTSYALFMIGGS